ncbi:hypothetical protein R69619_05451 [Paraburkholderia nemoris]|uniref:hypothetical protein n=1 Tax=Paraburkholderia nemoris TaxID=2793076 RepID=UPI0019093BA9|nr:hypothetical protein [Paraburkholderia nemoris]MBK3738143.1 hypothetical protein [Paraburkholderia aspalathi]CAE6806397.1 hypothetical protein R69619_05451 [Paraburkholderia nemoris]
MKNFNTRVELIHDANGSDYAELHQRMSAAGFGTIIRFNNGQSAHLPPAEYVHSTNSAVTAISIRDKAGEVVTAGLRPGLSFRLYVVEFVDWATHNLLPS